MVVIALVVLKREHFYVILDYRTNCDSRGVLSPLVPSLSQLLDLMMILVMELRISWPVWQS